MRYLLKAEELVMFLFGFGVWVYLGLNLPMFFLALLTPDVGMIGYLHSTKTGAITYNLTHHKAVALIVFAIGFFASNTLLIGAGLILWCHSSGDRALGFGLKYPDAFKHTHLNTA